MPPKYGILSDFEQRGFNCPSLLRNQVLEEFILDRANYYPSLVKVFYSNLETQGEALVSEVKQVQIFLSHHDFGKAFKVPSIGLQ